MGGGVSSSIESIHEARGARTGEMGRGLVREPCRGARRAFGEGVVRVDSRVEAQSHSERNTAMMRPFRCLKGSVAVAVVAMLIATATGGCAGAQEAAANAAGKPMIVYVGTYTGAKSKGIYMMRFDPATGKLAEPEVAAELKN